MNGSFHIFIVCRLANEGAKGGKILILEGETCSKAVNTLDQSGIKDISS